MNPDQQPDPKLQGVYNPLSVMRENEQVLCEIKRHPFGILGVYLLTGLVVVAVFAVAIYVPSHMAGITSQARTELFLGALLLTIIALLYAYVAYIVYAGNRWILTDDSLTQVTQDGLFRKHSSQLSLANLEDITADTNGIIQSLFGYGTLKAETAGERSKFVFPYCPNPNEHARKILAAREQFIMQNPEQAKRANDKLMTPPPPQYSAQLVDDQSQQPAQPQTDAPQPTAGQSATDDTQQSPPPQE